MKSRAKPSASTTPPPPRTCSGTIGSLTSDEWSSDQNGGPYKDKAGYQMSDLIGKSGLESALESYLHGTAGSRTVETDLGGSAIAEQTTRYGSQTGRQCYHHD